MAASPLPGRNHQGGRRSRLFCKARSTSWESPGVHSSQLFKRIFLVLGKAQLTIWTHLLGDDSSLTKLEAKQWDHLVLRSSKIIPICVDLGLQQLGHRTADASVTMDLVVCYIMFKAFKQIYHSIGCMKAHISH